MSIAEFLELEGGGRSRAAVAQAVQAYKGIVRTGKDRYALAEWGDSEYPRILPAMVERLGKHGAASIAELAVELEEEYGVSRASVQMYATLHPKFLAEDGMVRVRPADQPYQPQEDLTASANCYLVDGSWAVRLQVDRDLLRGAGRFIPEAFAVHLGARPLEKGQLHGPFGEISIGWDMTPSLGSIRREAQQLDLRTGDFLFVRRWSSASLDFTGLKKSDLEGKPDEARIKLLAGATTQDPRPWPLVLAEAIGIGAATAPDPADLLGRLRVRGDRDLITLVESLVGSI